MKLLELTPSQKKTVRHQFDNFCKKVLREEARNYAKHIAWRSEHEVSLSELSEEQINRAYILDEHPSDYTQFDVQGYSVTVHDDRLAQALTELPDEKRDILLLSYFLDMTDREIADKLNMVRYTIQRKRVKSLKEMKQRLEVNEDGGNQKNSTSSLLPYSTIEAAASGNVDAINAVLAHYSRYICALSTRTLYDENGVPHLCVDEELRRRLETKLITRILDFDVTRAA